MFSSRFSSKRGHLPKRHTLDPTLPEHSSRPPSAASLLVPRVCLIRSHTRLGSRPHAPSRRFFLFFRRLGGGGRWSRMRSRWMRWTTIETSAQMRRRRHPWNGFPLDEHGTRPHRSDNRSCADRSEHRRPTAQGRLEVCRGKGTQWRGGCSFAHVRSKSSSHDAYTRTYTTWITLHGYHKYLSMDTTSISAYRFGKCAPCVTASAEGVRWAAEGIRGSAGGGAADIDPLIGEGGVPLLADGVCVMYSLSQ